MYRSEILSWHCLYSQ